MHPISNYEYLQRSRQGILRIYTSAAHLYFADKLETSPIDGLTFLLTADTGHSTLLSPYSIRSILIDQHKIRIRLTDQK